MSGYAIRESVPLDLPAILEIERAIPLAAHWTEDAYRQLWNGPEGIRVALVAYDDSGVLGFIVAHEIAGEWELENVAVRPGFQGRGIGRGLLQQLLGVLESARATRLFLEVRESNLPARRLYESQGLRLSGRRKNYYGNPPEDALLFEKSFPF
jgi:ribosomal-protein-alanine N-acetyltransferase